MAAPRNLTFVNDYIYHVFNRGIERRNIFYSTKDYTRFVMLLDYYRFQNPRLSFSHYLSLPIELREEYLQELHSLPEAVEILAYCLMPNHFHLIVRQTTTYGIRRSVANISNGFSKYTNTKKHRVGPLYQGVFKAVLVETDEQLVHLSRYVHINPVVSSIITLKALETYPWSSFSHYLGLSQSAFVNSKPVLTSFSKQNPYKDFVYDQIDYGKKLEQIKHLFLEEV